MDVLLLAASFRDRPEVTWPYVVDHAMTGLVILGILAPYHRGCRGRRDREG